MKCPKCEGEEKTKNGFKNSVQRYKCKRCGCNYTRSKPYGYAIEVKRKALKYYLEGIGFRRIERLLLQAKLIPILLSVQTDFCDII